MASALVPTFTRSVRYRTMRCREVTLHTLSLDPRRRHSCRSLQIPCCGVVQRLRQVYQGLCGSACHQPRAIASSVGSAGVFELDRRAWQ